VSAERLVAFNAGVNMQERYPKTRKASRERWWVAFDVACNQELTIHPLARGFWNAVISD
jgi:hypothetical protein